MDLESIRFSNIGTVVLAGPNLRISFRFAAWLTAGIARRYA
jgi:hypothetical protein